MSWRTKGHYPFSLKFNRRESFLVRRTRTISITHCLSSFFFRSRQEFLCQVWKKSVTLWSKWSLNSSIRLLILCYFFIQICFVFRSESFFPIFLVSFPIKNICSEFCFPFRVLFFNFFGGTSREGRGFARSMMVCTNFYILVHNKFWGD